MSMRSLEKAVLEEAKEITGNKNLKMKDIMEWSTGEIKAQNGETLYRLPDLGVNIVVKTQA